MKTEWLLNKTKVMKEFKDLQVGDDIYIGFEKKTVTRVILVDDNYPSYPVDMIVYTSKDEYYLVNRHLSVDYCDNLHNPDEWIFTEKDAIAAHLLEKLRDIQIDYENKKSLCEKWLEKAKELE